MNSKKNTTQTILTITVGFLFLYSVLRWNGLLVASLITGMIGLFSDYLSQKIEWAWLQLTILLSFIVPNILLSLIFYLILFPIAFLSRVFGKKDEMLLEKGISTYYFDRNKNFSEKDFIHPW
jgi:hypothetical protein